VYPRWRSFSKGCGDLQGGHGPSDPVGTDLRQEILGLFVEFPGIARHGEYGSAALAPKGNGPSPAADLQDPAALSALEAG